MILLQPVRSLVAILPQRICEVALAWVTLFTGVIFTFNDKLDAARNPVLASLFEVATQDVWAVVFFTVGAVRLAVLIVNGIYFRTPHLRAILAVISVVLWYRMSDGAIAGLTLSASIYPVFIFADSYNAWRAAREAGTAEGAHEADSHVEHADTN